MLGWLCRIHSPKAHCVCSLRGEKGSVRQAGGEQSGVSPKPGISLGDGDQHPSEVHCLAPWGPRRDHEGPQANRVASRMCGLCFLLWAILWPPSQPNTLRVLVWAGPGGACTLQVGAAPCHPACGPTHLHPPPLIYTFQPHRPPLCSPELFPCPATPWVQGHQCPSPFQSPPPTPPPHPGAFALASVPSQTPSGLQAGTPQSLLPRSDSVSSLPPLPNPFALSVMSSLCPHLASEAEESKDSVLVSWSCRSRGEGQALGSGQLAQSPSAP